MEIQLTESQVAEIRVIELLVNAGVSDHGPDGQEIVEAVRAFGEMRFEEGRDAGWNSGLDAGLRSQGPTG